ncbi:MAG: VWA domain-containing protein [Planctomycetia bacterium]|nr:VWA domain-containing protein [Planctomycetia bacterium]
MRRLLAWFVRRTGSLCVAVGAAVAAAGAAQANGIVVESHAGGTRTGPSPVSLVAHRVHAHVVDRLADVDVEQVFRNQDTVELEGVYLFPLPEGAAVSRFSMTMGGRVVEGEVLAADAARAVYEGIVRRRQDPALLEYVGRGLYRAHVFPIPARGDVRVKLSYQQVLTDDGDVLELRYPLATSRLGGAEVAEVSVAVDVHASQELKAVYSPSHPVDVVRDGPQAAKVTWSRAGAKADRDFVLFLGSGAGLGLSVLSHKPDGADGTFVAVLTPPPLERAVPVPKDVIFVLDTSSSMSGAKFTMARRAVAAGLDALGAADAFALVTFASGVERFAPALRDAAPAPRQAARRWLEARKASGATDLEGGLMAGLRYARPGRLAIVVLVTDGRPSVGSVTANAVLERAQGLDGGRARVYTFGVGVDVDVALLDRIAEATGGAREYVADGADLERATGRFYAKTSHPVLTDVVLDFGAGVHDVYPSRIPTLFAGEQVVVFGRYPAGGPGTVRVTATADRQPVTHTFTATFRDTPGPAYLERLHAQRKVAYLLDAIRLNGEDEELVREVTELGTRYAIVTPYTSALVVEPGLHVPRPRGSLPGPVPPGMREPTDPSPPPPDAPAVPTTPPAPTTPSGGWTPPPPPAPDPTATSRALRDRKRSSAAEDEPVGTVRVVDARTFRRDAAGRWVDTAWDQKLAPKRIEAFSAAYFALVEKGGAVARVLALGPRVLFVLDGVAYEIVDGPLPK